MVVFFSHFYHKTDKSTQCHWHFFFYLANIFLHYIKIGNSQPFSIKNTVIIPQLFTARTNVQWTSRNNSMKFFVAYFLDANSTQKVNSVRQILPPFLSPLSLKKNTSTPVAIAGYEMIKSFIPRIGLMEELLNDRRLIGKNYHFNRYSLFSYQATAEMVHYSTIPFNLWYILILFSICYFLEISEHHVFTTLFV